MDPVLAAGDLDRRVTLLHRTLTKDTQTGEQKESWSSYATVWAQKLDLRGREFFAGQQMRYELTTTFRIRYRTDVAVTDRLTWNGLTYSIHGLSEIGRKVGIELACATVTAP